MLDLSFYKGKKVLVTGHTGFKGVWLSTMLIHAGAEVVGYSLKAPTDPSLFEICNLGRYMNSIIGDVRDYYRLREVFQEICPEIVFHLAAQPIVKEGYHNPRYTYDVNVMGTVNLLECVRKTESVKSVINVTTDKVYQNNEWEWGYRENEILKGYDPYSNSKSCSELITYSYKKSFFDESKRNVAISTVRAGNVIGGGDFAINRIIPDCIRYAMKREDIVVRNPDSVRPYQHVLEPLYAYLMIAGMQYGNTEYSGEYNVGPDETDCCSTRRLVELFIEHWDKGIQWISQEMQDLHEAKYLKLDCSRLKTIFGWKPKWNIEKAIEKTVEWTKCWISESNINACMDLQINEYISKR